MFSEQNANFIASYLPYKRIRCLVEIPLFYTMKENPPDQQLPGDPSLPSSPEAISALSEHIPSDLSYAVEDFFRLPEQIAFQLSPNGEYIAFLAPYERRNNIHVRRLNEEAAVRITSETDRSISSFFWASDDRIVFIKDSGGNENFQLFAVNKDGENAKDLTPFPEVTIQIIDELEDNEEELIIGLNKNNPQLFEPYRINIHTGDLQQIAQNTNPLEPIVQWITDHKGRLRAAIRMIGGVNEQLLYRATEEDNFKVVHTTNFRESLSPLFKLQISA